MDNLKLWYLHPFHFPTEHAHSIQILNTCRALAELGVEVQLPVKRNPDRKCASIEEALGHYGLTPHPNLHIEWLPTTHKGISGIAARWQVRRAKGERIAFYARHLRLALTAAKNANGPMVVELHKFEEDARAAAQAADGVVAITSPLRDKLVDEFDIASPTAVIPDAVDLDRFTPPTKEGAIRMVYTGNFHDWKGVDVIIRAIRDTPRMQALLIGGRKGDDPQRDTLKKLAQELGVEKQIEFAGHVPQQEIPSLLRSRDVGIVPTRGANGQDIAASPLKLFEYMAMGLPVIATDMPSIRDIITHEENGLLFEEGNAPALARLFHGLNVPAMDDDVEGDEQGRYERFARASRETAQQHSWTARAQKILGFLEPLIEAHA